MIDEKEQFGRVMTDIVVSTLKDLIDTCYKGETVKVMDVFKANIREFEKSRTDKDIKNMFSNLIIMGIAGDALMNSHGINFKDIEKTLKENSKIFKEIDEG